MTTVVLLMGAALLLGGFLVLRLTEQNLLQQKTEQLRLLTQTVASSLPVAQPKAMQEPLVIEQLQGLPDGLLLQGWWLYGVDLEQLAAFQTGEGKPLAAAKRQQVRLTGEGLEVVEFPSLLQVTTGATAFAHFLQPLKMYGRFRGLLEIRYSLDDVRYRLLRAQQMVLLYVLLYGAVLVAIGYYLLQRNIIKPARTLLAATEAVREGNLQTRLPLGGPTEIAQLAASYNQMVEALQQSREETEQHIAALQQSNSELQQARDELIRSEKLASVGQLAAGMAHELGNPLAALIGYLEVLKSRLQEGDGELVRSALNEAERIDFLVRELLDYSRPTETERAPLDPVEVLRSAVTLLQHQGAFRQVQVKDNLPSEFATLLANPHRLQQVFINLLLNAVQACEEGGEINLSAGREDGSVWLQVADNGCGIEPADLNRIFDPFYTTKSPGEGTGLGLAICHRLVEELGGRITVFSETGKGSRFSIIF